MAGKLGMKHTRLKYSKRLAALVVDLMEQGNTLSQLCTIVSERHGIELQPYTVLGWRRNHPDFKEEYELAYDSRSALWSDELYSIASAPMPLFDDKLQLTAELQRRRLQVDVLKVLLNKHRPTPTAPQKSVSARSEQSKGPIEISVTSYSDPVPKP
jgi:hypothetical protein